MRFTDLNAKLLVLDQLCHNLGLLPPYRGPSLPYEDYDPEAINEAALAYYRELPIPDELAARVRHLLMDGGLSIQQDVAPFWDGEDDLFDVRDWGEIARLPGLETVTATGPLPPEDRRLLRARGVVVEDDAFRVSVSVGRVHTVAGLAVRVSAARDQRELVERLLARLAELPAEELTAGRELRYGGARFRLVPVGERAGARWALSTPNVTLRAAGEERWEDRLGTALRLVRARERCLSLALLPDELPGPAPDSTETVRVEPGAERAAAVVLERRAPGPGDSGWLLRLPHAGDQPGHAASRGADRLPEAAWPTCPVAELWRTRPGALTMLALPVGFRVALDVDDVVAVTAPDGSARAGAHLPLREGGLLPAVASGGASSSRL
ncbi:hypothetical protein FH609_015580 [Streptomyces sp. 3MP-14]|uniref:DUF6892 domain-containing protein n=1 Tax=Streptomyces mimosae TaxID=2586635 RepID=A0A5N6AAG5_9ACTN|nr:MULTISPECIES: hypothetical protein [Streptomyces]KAB8165817.1 hypothetical protein FH607_012905 [Streptomyces mimosae]KAB8176206.1 hypothetical protein FH609_015580 [Streptomyces sp. 3MP-14]